MYVGKKYKSRLDRCYYKSNLWKVTKIKTIGTMEDCDVMPSDHFGLFLVFEKII